MPDFYKDLGSEVWYIFHHEPRGDPNGTAADFVSAWRRVRQVFRDRGAINVKFSWCLAGFQFDESGEDGAAGWYPGNVDVDIVSPDRYASFTGCENYENDTFEGRFRPVLQFATERDKPIAPAEWGCDRHPSDPAARPNWIRAAAAYMKRTQASLVLLGTTPSHPSATGFSPIPSRNRRGRRASPTIPTSSLDSGLAHVAAVSWAFVDRLTPVQLRTLAKVAEAVLEGLTDTETEAEATST